MTVKRIIALLLTVALAFGCVSVLAACKGGNEDQPQGGGTNPGEGGGNTDVGGGNQTEQGLDYTVTILDIFGEPVSGVKLKLTYDEGATEVLTTGADGKATKKIDTYDDVIVEFVEVPSGYSSNLTKAQRNLNGDTEKTLTLPTRATVNAVDEKGNPIAGVQIQVCHNVCINPISTNAEGKVVVGIASTSQIKASIVSVPEGYAIPEKVGDFMGVDIHAYFPDGVYEITIVIPAA